MYSTLQHGMTLSSDTLRLPPPQKETYTIIEPHTQKPVTNIINAVVAVVAHSLPTPPRNNTTQHLLTFFVSTAGERLSDTMLDDLNDLAMQMAPEVQNSAG